MILELQEEQPYTNLKTWLEIAGLPRSSYYEWKAKLREPSKKDCEVIETMTKIVHASKYRYGYRRVTLALKNQGFHINHKKVLRLMREEHLLSTKFRHKSRGYRSYKGCIGKIADNLVGRKFTTSRPNELWLTDVTEFRLKNSEKKVYLSSIMDVFNGEIIAYSLSQSPTTSFTNLALDEALQTVQEPGTLVIHSDQGFHYQHRSWVVRLEKAGIKQSMSRKGNCLDNSPMECFFGVLKQEMFYGENFVSIEDLKERIKEYIHWYNTKRIKTKLNGMSPVEYRLHSVMSK